MEFIRKKVKHYSIRIKQDGTVVVTIPMRGSKKQALEFVREKEDWIKKKQAEVSRRTVLDPEERSFDPASEAALRALAEAVFLRFASYRLKKPELKFRKMRSRWGGCDKKRGIVTLNKLLSVLPEKLQEYVVVHEFAHLVEPNHSAAFYRVVEDVLPDYRACEKALKGYTILRNQNNDDLE